MTEKQTVFLSTCHFLLYVMTQFLAFGRRGCLFGLHTGIVAISVNLVVVVENVLIYINGNKLPSAAILCKASLM